MPIQPPSGFSWQNFKAYSAFDEFLQTFVISRQSFLSKQQEPIDPATALADIRLRFADQFDTGKRSFDVKAREQFRDAQRNTKLFFAHAEYLWAMPSAPMTPKKKRSYARRFFGNEEIRDDDSVYFNGQDCIANPGPAYQTNKYNEVLAALRILSHLFTSLEKPDLKQIKSSIVALCIEALHGKPEPINVFNPSQYCGVYAALLHLADPGQYESIISKGHREKIPSVFKHVIPESELPSCPEAQRRMIREKLYHEHGQSVDPVRKYRWFFYLDDVKAIWSNKKTKKAQTKASILDELRREEEADELTGKEGQKISQTGYRIYRDPKLIAAVKKNDQYTCQACQFHFKDQIVHVHHLDPLCEREKPKDTTIEDLITLCPNCHYIAHYYLRDKETGEQYKQREFLLKRLGIIHG